MRRTSLVAGYAEAIRGVVVLIIRLYPACPAAHISSTVVGDMMESVGSFAFVVNDEAIGSHPTCSIVVVIIQAQAKVDVFLAVDEDGVKALQFGKVISPQPHAGASNGLIAAAVVGPGVFRLHTGIDGVAQRALCRENDADALDGSIGIK